MESHIDYNLWLIYEKAKYLEYLPEDVKNILDVGCGRGEWLCLLKKKNINLHGCDIDEECIRKSSQFAGVKKVDIMQLTKIYQDNQFDMVTAFHLLEHTSCPLTALEQMKRITCKYILLAVPNARYTAYDERPTHLYSWNGDTLKNLIEKAGLQILMLKQDRTNIFPNILRFTPIINRILLHLFIGPNELIALCLKEK